MAAALPAVHHHHRGPCRRARHPRVQPRPGCPPSPGGERLPRHPRHRGEPDADRLVRQGAAGGGVQRHLVLVAEPPRGDRPRSRRRRVTARPTASRRRCRPPPPHRAAVLPRCGASDRPSRRHRIAAAPCPPAFAPASRSPPPSAPCPRPPGCRAVPPNWWCASAASNQSRLMAGQIETLQYGTASSRSSCASSRRTSRFA